MFEFLLRSKSITRLFGLIFLFIVTAGWISLSVYSAKQPNQDEFAIGGSRQAETNNIISPLSRSTIQTTTDFIRRIPLTTNDAVYNPGDKMLYVSVPGIAGSTGNTITQVNPRTGEIGSSTYIGSEPDKLAMAADNQTLYVELRGAYAIRKFNTATQSPGLQFSSGQDSFLSPYQIGDLDVAVNNPSLIATSRLAAPGSIRSLAIYKDGVECPQTLSPGQTQFESLAFSPSGTMLFGTDYTATLTTMNVNAAGAVTVTGTMPLAVNPSMIEFDNGLIFTSGGQVIKADTRKELGRFPGVYSHTFVIDSSVGRAYYVVPDSEPGNLKINAYDINTFALVGSLTIPNFPGSVRALVRWGANGFALPTWKNDLVLIQTSLIPSSEPVPTPSPTASVTPSPSSTPFAVFTRQISLPTNDLIYNRVSQKIYASVPSAAGSPSGNSVTAIDPENGTIGNSIFVGSEPGKLALSGDSKTMYVGLNGSASVRKIDLAAQTAGLQFSLSGGLFGAYTANDIAVNPNDENIVAVGRIYGDIAVYSQGQQFAQADQGTYSKSFVVFDSANKLYSTGWNGITEYVVNPPTGITKIKSFPGDGKLHLENGLIYSSSGMVVDAATGVVKGTFAGLVGTVAMVIDSANNRAFFLANSNSGNSTHFLRAYELDTFRFIGSLDLQYGSYYDSRPPILVRWGANGLAFNGNDQIYLLQTSLVNSSVPVPNPTPTITPTPTPSPSPAYIPTFVRKVNLPVRDIVYNESTKSIYASVPSSAGTERGNSITQVSPESGAIGASVFVGSEPNKLVLADDGRTLYTTLDGANAIRRFDVVSQTPGLQFTPAAEVRYLYDLAVVPGKPESITLVGNALGGNETVVVYDNGVKRPKTGRNEQYSTITGVEFSSSSILYGVRSQGDASDLVKFTVDPEGVTEVSSTGRLFPGHDVGVKFAGGLLYSHSGQVVEPEAPRIVGTFNRGYNSPTTVDPVLGRVFFIEGNVLSAFDARTFLKIGSVTLPNFNGSPRYRGFVRWGANGLAVMAASSSSTSNISELYLIQSELVSASSRVPTGLQIGFTDNVFEGGSSVTVPIVRTGELTSTTSINYETIDGTARAGSDYTAASGTLVFAPGETSKNITIRTLNDNVYEETESFTVKLSNPGGGDNIYILSSDTTGVTIFDNEPKPIVSVSNITVEEPRFGTAEALFTVRLTNPTSQTVTVNYATNNGSATAGSDYLAASGTLTFNPLETTKTVSVKINADALNEGNEAFFLSLTNAVNTANTTGQATVIIRNTARRQLFDYDGDGRADISVFRPADGGWYISNSSNNSFRAAQFGISTDRLAPADYDGDGKTDIAVFREGFWYRINSSTNQFAGLQFGVAEDVPVPADFDGDGRADVAVFRPSEGTWYRLNSTDNQFVAFKWGTEGDKPIVGDFDGDNKADYAVYRSSAGAWYILRSSDNSFYGVSFGISEDIPTPADYDGDGKTDISVFRPSAGSWYRLNSSNNQFYGEQFGVSEDKPVAADYDGDGKADIAVFRPLAGAWYIQRSTSGFFAQQFGTNSDIPTPSAFEQ